jgi:phage-related protein
MDAKPFKGVGSGVYEIVKRYDTDTYRAVYAVKIGEKVYVLHAFQKKSKKGIKTPQSDVDLIKQRYKDALAREEQS